MFIFVICVINIIVDILVGGSMTTIAIKEETKRELLKFVSELQIRLGRKVDFDEAIRFLLGLRKGRNPRLLIEACMPSGDVDEVLEELYGERRKDEERIVRRFSG